MTFTVEVCNQNAQIRDAEVRIYQMGYFEVVDLDDFGYYSQGSTQENSFVYKFLDNMDPYECIELNFTAMAMTRILNSGSEVNGRVRFEYGGLFQTENDYIEVDGQDYIVLDGRTSPLYYSTAISNGILPIGESTCDKPGYPLDIVTKITVLGKFIIDYDLFCLGTITFGSIIMGEGAEIVVEDGSDFFINGDIESCMGMWKQIRVNTGGRILVNNHSLFRSTIKDGARAISLDGGSEAILQRITFENNHVGVYLNSLNTSSTDWLDPKVTRFSDLVFDNNLDGALKGTIDESLLALGQANPDKVFCGTFVKGGELINLSGIESNPNNWNKYFDMPNGIFISNGNVIVGRSKFERSYYDDEIVAPTGHAIYSRGNNNFLQVHGVSTSVPLIIQQADIGIRTIGNVSLDAKYITGSNFKKSIYTSSISNNMLVKVEDCDFSSIGEVGLHHRGLGKIDYNNNILGINGGVISSGGSSVLVGEGILATPVLYNYLTTDIQENLIDVNIGFAGITVYNSLVDIHENTVNLDYDDPAVINGIGLSNAFNGSVSCNLVTGTDYDSQTHTNGIFLTGASNLSVTCNDLTQTGVGLRFFGMNDATNIRANTMDEHLFGLAYGYPGAGNGTFTSPQAFRGNYWPVLNADDDPADRYGAIHYADNQQNVDQSKYIVNENEGKQYLPKWTAVSNWFQILNSQANQNCTESSVSICLDGPGANQPLTPDGLDERIMQDSLDQAVWQSTGIRRLLRRFSFNDQLLADTTFSAYHTSVLSSEEADWHDVAVAIRLSSDVDSTLQADVATSRNELQALTDSIFLFIDSLANATNGTDSLYWNGKLDTATIDYRTEMAIWELLADSLDQLVRVNLEDAWNENDALTPSNTWEENEWTINVIGLEMILDKRDTLSNTEKSLLEDIASQCPTEGGDAVWMARSLLLGVAYYSWDDSSLCEEAEERSANGPHDQSASFKISPTPASNVATIWSTMPTGSDLEISDLFGRTIMVDKYEGPGHLLTLSSMQSGTYVVRISAPGKGQAIQRLQVVNR